MRDGVDSTAWTNPVGIARRSLAFDRTHQRGRPKLEGRKVRVRGNVGSGEAAVASAVCVSEREKAREREGKGEKEKERSRASERIDSG